MGHAERRRAVMFRDRDVVGLSGLEIGPLTDPIVLKAQSDVAYVDHITTEGLIEKYRGDPNVPADRIVPVDHAMGGQTFVATFARDRYDYVVASHVAEHIPDLIGWLRDLHAILKPGGVLHLVLPDKRYSFDCRRCETTLADMLDAYIRRAKKPTVRQILDCALGVTEPRSGEIFLGLASADEFPFIHTVGSALTIADDAFQNDRYVDVHCSVFTPRSLARIMADLVSADLIQFSCCDFVDTSRENNFEFFVSLRKDRHTPLLHDSWMAVVEGARDPIEGATTKGEHV